MVSYSAIEKQQIMLMSDLLDHSLTPEECRNIQNHACFRNELIKIEDINQLALNEKTKEKIIDLLGQGMKLGIELNKLSKRGIRVCFISDIHISKLIYNYFFGVPSFLFVIGNEKLLLLNNVKVVFTYSEFKKIKQDEKAVFITDRKFDILLSYEDVISKLINHTLVLISNFYKNKSLLKNNHNTAITQESKKDKVFISGSRSQNDIPKVVQESLKRIMEQNFKILIGDSEKGVDSEIIKYLRGIYDNVEIFTIKKKPRVQVKHAWKQRYIQPSEKLNAQEKQMEKDRKMADEADWGLAIFQPIEKNRYGALQVSSGTLRNAIQMLLHCKPVKFFYVYEKQMKCAHLKTIEDLTQVIQAYEKEKLTKAEIEEIMSAKGTKLNEDAVKEKYQRVNQKYHDLLKKEEKLLERQSLKNTQENEINQISLFNI